MSIPLVIQTYDEVRRLAIAGSVVAAGDFRLKKLIEPLRKSAEKAPVFGKVADGIDKLVGSPEKETGPALLELGTLVNAILYTQGETGATGDITDLPAIDMGVRTSSQASARVLKPLMEALTTTGSGRLEIITEAHKRDAFRDLRLVNHALRALDDVYAEIADFVGDNVLPIYGKAIIPELRAAMKFPGKQGDARRLKLLYRLDPKGSRDLVEQAFADGSKELKVAALGCLGDSKEDLPHLLEQSSAKARDVRMAALQGLSKIHDDDLVVEVFTKALAGKDLEYVVHPASRLRNPKLLAWILESAKQQLADLFTCKEKDKLKAQLIRFNEFLPVFDSRTDPGTEAFIADCFARRAKMQMLKGDMISGADINATIASHMSVSKSPRLLELLAGEAMNLSPDLIQFGIAASMRNSTPAQAFDRFSPLLKVKIPEKGGKIKDDGVLRAIALRELLIDFRVDYHPYRWRRHYSSYLSDLDSPEIKPADLDPRWLDVAVAMADLDLVTSLIRPDHKASREFLAAKFQSVAAQKTVDIHTLSNIIDTMVRINHPHATDCWITAMQKATASKKPTYYGTYWLSRSVESLPVEAAAKIEALLPSLPERVIDEVLPHLQALKERATAAKK